MIALAALVALAAQPGGDPQAGSAKPPAALVGGAALTRTDAHDDRRGHLLIERFECARCHAIGGHGVVRDKSCVDCHRAILAGELAAPREVLQRWQGKLHHLLEVPSLLGVGGHLRPEWIAAYLQRPHDLRRGLGETMPRLALSTDDAARIAKALTGGKLPPDALVPRGDSARGLAVLEAKGCAACHAFTGARALGAKQPAGVDGAVLARGIKLAPDLRWTRDRTTPAAVDALLRDARAAKADAAMPAIALADAERADLIAAIFDTPLPLAPAREPPPRLPVLARKVRFDEIQQSVLDKTCIHCHADDSRNLGVGGPGSSGGFGYAGTGLVLTSYARVQAGSQRAPTPDRERDDLAFDVFGEFGPARPRRGAHMSIFRPVEQGPMKGVPLLVAQLRARQLEEAGETVPGVVGMPLGLPAVTPEELQLVDSWVAQGRPQ